MRMPSLGEVSAFLAVADHASFARAATHLGVSTSTVSMNVRSFEERLGARLLNRTSRSVALTEVGERIIPHLRLMLSSYDATVTTVGEFQQKPRGTLRLHAYASTSEMFVEPLLRTFLAEYPGVSIEISTDASVKDIVGAGFDAGIGTQNQIAEDMIAVRINEQTEIVVGSPGYLETHGVPQSLDDLKSHNCIRRRDLRSGVLQPWRLRKNGKMIEVEVNGSLILGHSAPMVRAALNGIGLTLVGSAFVQSLIDEGRLTRVLAAWSGESGIYFLYYPSRRQAPLPLRALIDFLKADKT